VLSCAQTSAETYGQRETNHLRWGLAAAPKLTRRFMSSPAARLSRRARFLADAAYGSAVDTIASTCNMTEQGVSLEKIPRPAVTLSSNPLGANDYSKASEDQHKGRK
jgi:hypothetical protein